MYGVKKVIILALVLFLIPVICLGEKDRKEPNVAGQFYPSDKGALSRKIDSFLNQAQVQDIGGDIICLISPHAGYDFSGVTAAFGYKLIQGRQYKTVIVIGPSHHYNFRGMAIYPKGKFCTPLGCLEIDTDFVNKLSEAYKGIIFSEEPFSKEHSVEVQLPFLQKVLAEFKIVPVVFGGCDFKQLKDFANSLSSTIGKRKDVLMVASSDLYHGYNWQEAEAVDSLTLSCLKNMEPQEAYENLNSGKIQMCGGLPVVCALLASRALGHKNLKVLKYTNSAQVTERIEKGAWTVGYASCAIDSSAKEENMLDEGQKKALLVVARSAIREYVNGKRRIGLPEVSPRLNEINGAFVTLHKHGTLRGCIGNIVGQKPLIQTVRDMAIESATSDPRFPPVESDELKDIEIEISVLSPLKKIRDISEFELGAHGVLVRRGWQSGVFLPQVATETGWTKEEFLSNLCAHKAGLAPSAWKEPGIEIFIFSALVFSEKEFR